VTTFREPFPILAVDDVGPAGEFYVSTFGFELKYRFPLEGEPDFLFLSLPAPADQPWGERMTTFRDLDGHLLVIVAPIE